MPRNMDMLNVVEREFENEKNYEHSKYYKFVSCNYERF